MVTFRQFLKDKEVNETITLTPQQIRAIIGNSVGSAQPADPNADANALVTKSGDNQLIGALAQQPLLRKIGDDLLSKQQTTANKKNINTNVVGNAINTASIAGAGQGGTGV